MTGIYFIDSLLNLPKELIELIFWHIPDEFLQTYIDNPLIGMYALDILLDKVYIEKKKYCSPELLVPIGDEFQDESSNNNGWQASHKFSFHNAYQFLQFMEKHPDRKPRVIEFEALQTVLIIHNRKPSLLEGVKLQVRYRDDDPLEKEILTLPYDFQRLLVQTRVTVLEIPETVEELEVPSSMLCNVNFPALNRLKTMSTLDSCILDQLCYLPTNLTSLDLKLTLGDDTHLIPHLPISLKSLTLGLSFLTPIPTMDLSSLKDLKFFSCIQRYACLPLHCLTLPTQISSLMITCTERLDSIVQFSQLKRLYVELSYKVNLHEILFPDSLEVLEIAYSNAPVRIWSVILNQLLLPPKLYSLTIDCFPGNLDFSSVRFPSNISVLRLEGCKLSGFKLPLSLTTLLLRGSAVKSLRSFNFEQLPHLVRLDLFDIFIESFEHLLPPSLKYLCLGANTLLKICIEAPGLVVLDLLFAAIEISGPDSFEIPDTVIKMSLKCANIVVKLAKNSEEPKPKLPQMLPKSLKHLDLNSCLVKPADFDIWGDLGKFEGLKILKSN